MVAFIAGISLLNLVLGFALAAWLHDLLQVSVTFRERPPAAADATAALVEQAAAVRLAPPAASAEAVDPIANRADDEVVHIAKPLAPEEPGVLSTHWEKLLAEAESAPLFVEASVQVLRLEVGRYRQALIAIDDRVRGCLNRPDLQKLQRCLDDLQSVNRDWTARQADAAGHLVARQESLGSMAATGTALRDILDDQRAQIETTCNNIGMLDFTNEPAEGCSRLVREISRLIDTSHALRDRMLETISVIARQEGKLDSLDPSMCVDGPTELPNRTGLESEFFRWRRDDPDRLRQLCLAVFDVDRLGPVNEDHGAVTGDRLLQGLGLLLASCVRQDRGYDIVARIEGQQFACLFGDTGPRNAICAAERIRQTLAAARFEYEDRGYELTVSCGLTEVSRADDMVDVLARLEKAVRAAKAAGRNRTFLDDGQGLEPVTAPRFNVPSRLVKIEA